MPSRSASSLPGKALLVLRVWAEYARVRFLVHRRPLPQLVARLAEAGPARARRQPVARLSRAVARALTVRGRRPTCLVNSLVLFRLLTRQGEPAELVVGLAPESTSHEAHAWVELEGADVGPVPGRGPCVAIAQFGHGSEEARDPLHREAQAT